MTTPLLTTKFHIPHVRPQLVSRPRLTERLNAGLQRKLTLISAPAGFGKTTLVSEWVRQVDVPVAWLSLEESDNDPKRFLSYFVAALQTIDKDIGEDVVDALQSAQLPSMERVVTALINQVSALPHGLALVLDDYHLITAQPIHQALAFLLDHLPVSVHLVITTRADPPVPIARLRGRGQLLELRQTDLRFGPAEAAEFLNRVMGLELSANDVSALASRTEGWIAGLQMAAVSMQGREDASSFVRALTGSNRYIMDYLLEEVLARQPQAVQTFLLQTSILKRLCGPLCDAVTGGQESQTILETLERTNLFVVPLDDQRAWYRYHRLFADLLRQQLLRTVPDIIPALHRQASQWLEQNGWVAEAIDHALSAQDFLRAAELIQRVAQATVMRSEFTTFMRWMERLPEEFVVDRPSLNIYRAWGLLLTGRWLEVTRCYSHDQGTEAGLVSRRLAPMRALIAMFRGQLPDAVELSRQALEGLPESDLFLRSVAAWNLGLSRLAEGDIRAGKQSLEEVVQMSQQMGNVLVVVMALCSLAAQCKRQGQLGEAKELNERALGLAADHRGHRLPAASEPLMALGELWREWNDLPTATRFVTDGIELTRQWAPTSALDGYLTLARVCQAQGDLNGVRDAISHAQQLAVQFDATDLDDVMVALLQGRLWIAQGNIEAAQRLAEQHEFDKDAGWVEREGAVFALSRMRKYRHLLLARLRLAQHRPSDALVLLEPILSAMERQGRTHLMIEILNLIGLAHHAQDDTDRALAALERSLTLAKPGGYVRSFVDEGVSMASLLYEAAARGIAPRYTGKLLAAFPAEEAVAAFHGASAEMIEPLTDRELQVLRLVAEGCSNQEIAERLFLSLPTVKWHTGNIYGKLAVKNRTQAVARARALAILPST
jgi:LuxR family maltose regulon positive regulatory protein